MTETEQKPHFETHKKEYTETDEWSFYADVRVRLHNPEGSDVVLLCTYTAQPRDDSLTSKPDEVHETIQYWWPNSYPANGDSPFTDSNRVWKPATDLDDHDELLDECLFSATYDPEATLDSLTHNNPRIAEKLGMDP
jgi:hypothetical protein